MYCRNCGKELAENAKFCRNCGAQINAAQSAGSSFAEEGQSKSRQAAETQSARRGRGPRRRDRWWKILLVIIVCAAAVAVFFFLRPVIQEQQLNNHMEDGKTFLEDEDYDEAVAEFSAAIAIDPKVVPAYQQLAEAYINLDEPGAAEDTYRDARDEILDSYEESGLLDGAEDLYKAAITYYGEKGIPAEVEELVDEITGMLPDEEEAAEIKQLGQTYTDNEDTGKTGQSDDSEKLSEEQVGDLLGTFKDWAETMLGLRYSTYTADGTNDLSSYETIDAADAYVVAAMALRDSPTASEGTFQYLDGIFYSSDEYNALSTEQKEGARPYIKLTTSEYEKYLQNLFGDEYNLDDFSEYAGQVNDIVLESEDGQFYVEWGDYINEGVDVAIVDFPDDPDEDGVYTFLAKYTIHWAGGEPDNIYYMQYRIIPDNSTAYGCRVVGMVPAGDGEIEDAFKSQAEVKGDDSDDEPYMEWQQLYADYIEQEYLEIDTEAESVNQVASEEVKEYYYYYLIYLNDDDVPELLRCSTPNYNYGMTFDHLLYIQDSQVKEQEITSVSFAERGGYISSQASHGAMTTTVWRLNEQNELVTELEAYEDYTEISINGQEVSQAEHDSKVREGLAWMTSGEYKVLSAGNGSLELLVSSEPYDTYEEYASPFATGASAAIEALRGGYVEPV